jgi:hypothetical protein
MIETHFPEQLTYGWVKKEIGCKDALECWSAGQDMLCLGAEASTSFAVSRARRTQAGLWTALVDIGRESIFIQFIM